MEDKWLKVGVRIILLVGVLVVVGAFFGMTRKFWRSAPFSVSGLVWSKRILFNARSEFTGAPVVDLRTMNVDGTDEIHHRLVCEGEEVEPSGWENTRSADGRVVAFLLPDKTVRDQNRDWKYALKSETANHSQGEIFLFDLSNNSCMPTEVIADRRYGQKIAFSPDRRYLAYVFHGVRLYDVMTGGVTVLTEDPGSARIGTIVTGPLVWNQKGTAVYVAMNDTSINNAGDGFPTSLYRIEIEGARKEKMLELPKYFPLHETFTDIVNWEWTLPPDDPLLYAVSPDETRVIVEEEGNLVVKYFNDLSGGSRTLWRRTEASGPLGHALEVIWLPSDWVVVSVEPEAVGSSAGSLWISKGGAPGWGLSGFQAVSDLEGNLIAFNFGYFGDYYVPRDQPTPEGFESTGHKWDGIGVYDLNTGRETKLSGKGRPTGTLWSWFW